MSNRSDTFGRLLKGAINSIAAYEGKAAPTIEEELGNQIGLTGAAIQRYKAGYLPPEPRTTAALAEAGVRRGFLSRVWLTRFLQAARYPTPEVLISQLGDVLGSAALPIPDGLPTGTLALLFTDIAGSTRHWEQQPRVMERALERHDALLRQAVESYGGQVFKTVGDAFYTVFTTMPAALDAALAAQRALCAENWGAAGPLKVRMAIHVGALQPRGSDYFGPPLNRVARILSASHGRQILLSFSAQELVRDLLPSGVTLRDLGEHQLKDLGRPERIFQTVAPGLPAEFPPLRSLDSYHHNLPPQATPLIGREDQVAAVASLLERPETRLVTLTGPGGIGKTRLALQVAVEELDEFADGAVFVPLAPIREPELVVTAIAQALRVVETPDMPLQKRVQAFLRPRQMLLVLDNFEQVIAAAPLVAELLATALVLKVLVTSREALRLYGEQEYAVPPLTLPDMAHLPPLERLTQYEAVRLFIERAQAVRPEFEVSAVTAPVIAEICARLDGLPLAIELAAARVKVFPPQALLARLDRRLQLLIGGPRNTPARLQTLAGAIAWSYDMLDVTEQTLFARLAVFSGGCTLAAAEAVLADDGRSDATTAYVPSEAIVNGISSLIDKSLLRQLEGFHGEPRFLMLETVREFAVDQLAKSGEEAAIRDRHASYYAAVVNDRQGDAGRGWFHRVGWEIHNVRAVLAWALTSGKLEPGIGLASNFFFWENSRPTEGRHWAHRFLALPPLAELPSTRYGLYHADGTLARQQGDYIAARAAFRACLDLEHVLGGSVSWATWSLALCDLAEGAYSQTLATFQNLLAAADRKEIGSTVAWLIWSVAIGAYLTGDFTLAMRCIQETRAHHEAADDRIGVIATVVKQGYIARQAGDLSGAVATFAEAIALAEDLGYSLMALSSLAGLAGVAQLKGNPTLAARLFGAATSQLERISSLLDPDELATNRELAEAARSALGDEAYRDALEAGGALTLEQALAEAFSCSISP